MDSIILNDYKRYLLRGVRRSTDWETEIELYSPSLDQTIFAVFVERPGSDGGGRFKYLNEQREDIELADGYAISGIRELGEVWEFFDRLVDVFEFDREFIPWLRSLSDNDEAYAAARLAGICREIRCSNEEKIIYSFLEKRDVRAAITWLFEANERTNNRLNEYLFSSVGNVLYEIYEKWNITIDETD